MQFWVYAMATDWMLYSVLGLSPIASLHPRILMVLPNLMLGVT